MHNAPTNGAIEKTIEAIYQYRDGQCKIVHETVRYRLPNGEKAFKQRRPAGAGEYVWSLKGITPVLYNLPGLMADLNSVVWIVEGEKDADNLIHANRLATCNPMGALKWHDRYAETLRGRNCRIIPDNDEKGREHARRVLESLRGKAGSVKIVNLPGLPDKGDVSDWLAAGHTVKELDELAADDDGDGSEQLNNDPLLNKDGKWIACQRNSEIWLSQNYDPKLIRHDTFAQSSVMGDRIVGNDLIISLTSQIEESVRVRWYQEHMRSALINIGNKNEFSSLTDWLDTLQWDGIDRINMFFADCFDSGNTTYSQACSRVFFLSAVARAYKPGCQADTMIVLIGKQGFRKSTGIASLCPNVDWFAEDLGSDLANAKTLESLQGKWLVEFSEFSRINRMTLDMVKSFLTRRVDTFLRPYGRGSVNLKRQCVFIGTTNNPQPLHDDENRRFMPLHVKQGNINAIEGNRDQLWAEAVHRFNLGEKWWIDSSQVLKEVVEHQENARLDDAWEDILRSKLDSVREVTAVQAAGILGLWDDRPEKTVNRLGKSEQIRIGYVLRAIGFDRKRRSTGDREWYYERVEVGTE